MLRGKGCWLSQGKQGGEKHSLPSPLNCCVLSPRLTRSQMYEEDHIVVSQGLKCMRRTTLLASLESANGAFQTEG